MSLPALYSEVVPWASGGTKVLPLHFMQRASIRKGRQAIFAIKLVCGLYYTTGGGVSMAAPDLASGLKRVQVSDAAGLRRDLSGPSARLQSFIDWGIRAPAAPTAVAGGETNTLHETNIWLAFGLPGWEYAKRGPDGAMPVDQFLDNGKIRIEMPAASDLIATGGTPTIVSGYYQAFGYVREEWDTELHSRDVIEEVSPPGSSNTDFYIPCDGRILKGLYTYKHAAGGGTAMTLFVDASMKDYGAASVPKAAFVDGYLSEHTVRTADDPIYNAFSVPLIYPGRSWKQTDGFRIAQSMHLRATNTLSGVSFLANFVAPKDQRVMATELLRNGYPEKAKLKVKTAGKSLPDQSVHGDMALFLPSKPE